MSGIIVPPRYSVFSRPTFHQRGANAALTRPVCIPDQGVDDILCSSRIHAFFLLAANLSHLIHVRHRALPHLPRKSPQWKWVIELFTYYPSPPHPSSLRLAI